MRLLTAVALSLAALGCGNSPLDRRPDVRFEVRPFTLAKDETESATSFTHRAPIVAIGDSADAQRPYMVMIRVVHLGGGNPELWTDKEIPIVVPVLRGAGEIEVYGGYRPKATSYQPAATWEPAQVRAEVIGYVPIITP